MRHRFTLPALCLSGSIALLGAATSGCTGDIVDPIGPLPHPTVPSGAGATGPTDTPSDGTAGGGGTTPASPEPSCTDHVKNGTETDTDCGGECTTKCALAHHCGATADCAEGTCVKNVCVADTCTDGLKGDGESDVDCGGASCAPCDDGKACLTDGDCSGGLCAVGFCQAPSAVDDIKNGTETDVDCGGGAPTNATRCDVGQACLAASDCASRVCNANRCALPPSCSGGTDGITTCGRGEVGAVGAAHESCCRTANLPGSTVKLDVYKVTAGRMRAFVNAMAPAGNVAGWYAANRGNLPATVQAQIDPYTTALPSDLGGYPLGVNYQLGGYIYLQTRPSTLQGCFVGNSANRGNGVHTYANGTFDGDDRGNTQAFTDRLPVNCVTYPMMAAFCAWDGGRLQMIEEHEAAFGTTTYPTDAQAVVDMTGHAPGGFADLGVLTRVGPANVEHSNTPCPACDLTLLNWSGNYANGNNPSKPWDLAYFISPPGRFARDRGPAGHMDVGGDLMELTATPDGTETMPDLDGVFGPAGANVTQPRVRWTKNGSWEGHGVGMTWSFAVMTKYGSLGGRCARD